jgi:hypothetical protein
MNIQSGILDVRNIEVLSFPALDMNQVDGEASPEKSNRQVLVRTACALVEIDKMFALVLRSSTNQGRRGILLFDLAFLSPA